MPGIGIILNFFSLVSILLEIFSSGIEINLTCRLYRQHHSVAAIASFSNLCGMFSLFFIFKFENGK